MSNTFTHLDDQGQAHMVDVGGKVATQRRAIARAILHTRPDVIEAIAAQHVKKGDVLAVARVGGIMAAKNTAQLIPLCHPLALDSITIDFELEKSTVHIRAAVTTTGKTGVEMEALAAASVAALSVYDMCKALDRAMTIESVRLEEKSGGQRGDFRREEATP